MFCLQTRVAVNLRESVSSLSREFLNGVHVVVGEFDQTADDEEQLVFLTKMVPSNKYHYDLPVSYDSSN